jgi:uncharacterized integral membrane protein (TIGR00698 family)
MPRQRALFGFILLVILTLFVAEVDRWVAGRFAAQGIAQNPLEYPITAVIIGLIAQGLLRVSKLYERVQPAIQTDLYMKIGLVILGARISIGDLLATGAGGIVQAVLMVTCVFFFTWWLGSRFSLSRTLKAVMACAVSICGVSAAVAAAGAVSARKEEVTYVSTLVILTSLPLMVIMPWVAGAVALPQPVAGAWFGSNIDTTASVVGAGAIYGTEAEKVATIVKLTQNVLIGFVAFGLALYFVMRVNQGQGERPGLRVIWQRFPKFVLGFILVSILASLRVFSPALIREMTVAYQWIFAAAFVCMGLDFSAQELQRAGWLPLGLYLAATVFNAVLGLGVSAVIFGWLR